jgi:hypothetical protein
MITTTFDPVLDALLIGLILLAPCLTWFWAKEWDIDSHWANGFFGAVGVVAALVVVTTLVILLGMGVMAAGG